MRRSSDDSSVECESGFKQRGESMLKVQWWQVILIFIAAAGFSLSFGNLASVSARTQVASQNIDLNAWAPTDANGDLVMTAGAGCTNTYLDISSIQT